jgi:hypothetical protein
LLVGGLLAITLLWAPFTGTKMSFSGPVQKTTSYGILAWREETIDYRPQRLSPPLGGGPFEPPTLGPDQEFWDHHGEFGKDRVILTVLPKPVTMSYLSLAASVLLTVVLLWAAVLMPVKKLVQSFRAPPQPVPEA